MRSPRFALASAGVGVALALGTLLAAPASAAPTSQACLSAQTQYNIDHNTLVVAQNTYRADKANGVSNTQLAIDLQAISQDQAKVQEDQAVVNVQCNAPTPVPTPTPTPTPIPVVTVGGIYPVPPTQTERRHLIQVCIDNNQGLLSSISASVLARDCAGRVPPCPIPPPPCNTCTTTPPPPPPVVQQPPVFIQGPTTVLPGPVIQGPSTVLPGPGPTQQIVQAPSGSVSTGATAEADRYIG